MSTTCAAGVTPDDLLRAAGGEHGDVATREMKEHVETCAACALYANGLAFMRDTWRAEHARDARGGSRARSERQLATSRDLRMYRRTRPMALALALAVAALAVVFLVHQGARTPTPTATAAGTAPPAVSAVPAVPAPLVVPAAQASSAPVEGAIADSVHPTHIDPPEPVRTAPRAPATEPTTTTRLAFAWSVTLDDAAVATTHDHDAPPWVDLREGTARVDTRHPGEVRTAQVIVHGDDAAWAVRARAGATHVDVTRGTVTLAASHGMAQRATLRAPASADVGSDGRIVVPSTPAPAADPAEERASFSLAEVELARGDKARGRTRLAALVGASDLSIAGDAAFLLARTAERPQERVAILGRYLTRHPPSPYRQQALVEQGHAFVDTGDLLTARAIAADLRADPAMPDVARPSLARLTARLSR